MTNKVLTLFMVGMFATLFLTLAIIAAGVLANIIRYPSLFSFFYILEVLILVFVQATCLSQIRDLWRNRNDF